MYKLSESEFIKSRVENGLFWIFRNEKVEYIRTQISNKLEI